MAFAFDRLIPPPRPALTRAIDLLERQPRPSGGAPSIAQQRAASMGDTADNSHFWDRAIISLNTIARLGSVRATG